MPFESNESVFRVEALKIMRSDLARSLSVDIDTIADPWEKARISRVRENVADSAGLNAELLPLFPGSGATMFDELPMLKVDYGRGLPILLKWLKLSSNPAVLSEILKMVLAYFGSDEIVPRREMTEALVSAIPRLTVYGRTPMGFAGSCQEFASKVVKEDLDLLLPLLNDDGLPDSIAIVFYDRFTRARRSEGRLKLSHFLQSDERSVLKTAIAMCARTKATEFVPRLTEIAKSGDDKVSKPANRALEKLVVIDSKS